MLNRVPRYGDKKDTRSNDIVKGTELAPSAVSEGVLAFRSNVALKQRVVRTP